MIPYLSFYSLIVIFYLFSENINFNQRHKNFYYFIFLVSIVIFTGLRTNIGGDWVTYEYNYMINGLEFEFSKYSLRSDYGWELISYIFYKLGFTIHLLYFISSLFFFFSLNFFINSYDSKLLVYIISFPILIIILLMGYSRQAMAFSFLLLALPNFFKEKYVKAFIFLTIGIFFHKSLLLFFIIFLLCPIKIFRLIFLNRVNLIFIFFFSLFVLLILYLIQEDLRSLYLNYFGGSVNTNPVAEGAYHRWFVNFIPSALFIIFFQKFTNNYIEKRVYLFFSLFCIFSVIFIPYYATGIDRYLYYFSLTQIYVFSQLPIIFYKYKKIIQSFVIIYYYSILLIWLNFSYHKFAWLPYNNLLFDIFK